MIVDSFADFLDGSSIKEKLLNLTSQYNLCLDEKRITGTNEISFDCYSSILALSKILSIIPASNASSERAFSKLKVILTEKRSTMTEERLNSLSIISSNFDSCPQVEDVIQRFKEVAPRRLNKFI